VIRLRCGAFALAVISVATLSVAVAQATLSSHLRAATSARMSAAAITTARSPGTWPAFCPRSASRPP